MYEWRKDAYPKSGRLRKLLEEEGREGLYKLDTFILYGKKIEMHRSEIRNLLLSIRQEGKKVFGVGAPAKGNTLLNYCSITPELMQCITEKSSLKIGLYTPGTHIRVIDEAELFSKQPEYAFILSWNLADELVPKLRKAGYKGKIIIPIPKLRIVE